MKSFCLRLLFCFIKDLSTGYLLAGNYGQVDWRELPRSGEKKNIVLVARLCFMLCEADGWEVKMGKYFDRSLILGGNAANGGYCYELGESQVPSDLTTVMSDKRNCSA